MLFQLPDDVAAAGFKKVNEFQFEQVFESKKHDFKGTEKEFVKAGLGYAYVQIDAHTRRVVSIG